MQVAVTGATGYIGGRLVPGLLGCGHSVLCLARDSRKLEGHPWASHPNVAIVQANLDSPQTLAAALEGVEAAFYLVHSMISAGRDYAERDRSLAKRFAAAASEAHVQRIIYLGGLGETGTDLSEHLSSRREVEHALASARVPVTVLRAAMIIGSGSASFEILRYLVERLPAMITPKWVSTPCQPIAVGNVIGYLSGVLDCEETVGEVYDIGGPEVLCYREIMQVMAQELGVRRRLIIPVPVLTPRLSSYWIHLVTPVSHAIARPLAEGLKNPVVCRDDRIRALVPQELLTVRESIRAALGQVAAGGVETVWSMAGPIPGDPDWAGGAVFRDEREIAVNASADSVFRAICRIGGGQGWYAADWLWKVRGFLDRMVGGPGLRRGRRSPETVAYGEALDFWRVVGVEPGRRLSLRAEMKLPGEALLEFRIESESKGCCRLRQAALFKPRGLLGIAYWYAVAPLHHIVFAGMIDGIRRAAEQSTARA